MKRFITYFGVAVAASVGAVDARPQQIESGWRVSARAAPMCEVTLAPVSHSDTHTLGAVREFCNSGQGYSIEIRFANLSGGELQIGSDRIDIPESGAVFVQSTKPQLRTRVWRVHNPVYVENTRGAAMTLSIFPLT